MTTPYCTSCGIGFERVEADGGEHWECPGCGDQRPIIEVTVRAQTEPPEDECEACWRVRRFEGRLATDDNMAALERAQEYASDPDNHDDGCDVLDVPQSEYAWD